LLRDRSPRSAGFASALVALSPALLPAAQEARMYALMACLCTGMLVCLLHGMRRGPSSRAWLAWAALGLAAFLTHILGAVVLAAHGIVILVWWLRERRPGRARLASIIGVVAALCVGFLAYIVSFGGRYGVSFVGTVAPVDALIRSAAALALPRLEPAVQLPLTALIGAAVVIVGATARGNRIAWMAAVLSLLGISVFGMLSGKFASRYPVIVATPLLALAGASIARWPAAWLFGVIAMLSSVLGVARWQIDPQYRLEDYRGAVAFLRTNTRADESVLLMAGHTAPALDYYWPDGRARVWHPLPADAVLDVRNTLDYAGAVPTLNSALAGKRGAWLLLWQDVVVDPALTVQTLLARQATGLQRDREVTTVHGLRLLHFSFDAPFVAMPLAPLRPVSDVIVDRADAGLTGLGCLQLTPANRASGLLELTCFWRKADDASAPLDTQVSLRLNDATGKRIAQHDTKLAALGLPYFAFDKPIITVYFFPFPRDLAAGDYTLEAVPYTPTGEIAPRVVTRVTVGE
jgi:hypothetical protein